MNKVKPKRKTRAELQQHIKELCAQLPYTHHAASMEIQKVTKDRFAASGVLLELTALGGRQVITPVVIRGGLSQDTIEALHRDIVRSWEESVEFKPVALNT